MLASPAQPLSKALLADAVSMLGNYVVYMEVGGTVELAGRAGWTRSAPLTEDVARFFLLRFVNPVPVP